MTAPATSSEPVKSSKRLYILWAVALTLLLAIGLFCWLVIVPVYRTGTVIGDSFGEVSQNPATKYAQDPDGITRALERLGGREQALAKLSQYYRWQIFAESSGSSPESHKKGLAVLLMGYCGPQARDTLLRASEDPNSNVRLAAIYSLGTIALEVPDAFLDLKRLQRSEDPLVQLEAERALKRVQTAAAQDPRRNWIDFSETPRVLFEAESARFVGPFLVASRPEASGGKYLALPGRPHAHGESHAEVVANRAKLAMASAEYEFTIRKTGKYFMWMRMWTCCSEAGSYEVKLDSVRSFAFACRGGVHRHWAWRSYSADGTPVPLDLSAGSHKLLIKSNGKIGARIDQILFVAHRKFLPQGREKAR
jgi:HEAT repeats